MSRRLVVVAAAALAALVLGAGPVAAEGATVGDVGWWTRNPLASAPEGGLAVSNAPDGEVSVGAVRVTVQAELEQAALVLPEAGGSGHTLAALRVCPTPNRWSAGKGDLDDAPKPECAGSTAAMQRNATLGSWSADVLPLLADAEPGDTVSLMVVPAEGPSAWDLQFDPPQLMARAAPASADDFGGSGGDDPGGSDSSAPASGSFGYRDPPAATFAPADDAPAARDTTVSVTDLDQPSEDATDAVDAGEEAELGSGFPSLPARPLSSESPAGGPSRGEAVVLVLVSAAVAIGAAVARNRLHLQSPASPS